MEFAHEDVQARGGQFDVMIVLIRCRLVDLLGRFSVGWPDQARDCMSAFSDERVVVIFLLELDGGTWSDDGQGASSSSGNSHSCIEPMAWNIGDLNSY